MGKVGIYLGTKNDSTENIEKVLRTWGTYLSSFHHLQVFGSAKLPKSCSKYYDKFETKNRSTDNPYSKILSSFFDSLEYIKHTDPDIILQIWKSPTHAPGVSLCGRLTSTPVVTRLSGDSFNEFENLSTTKKYAAFILNNIIGRISFFFSDNTICLGPNGESKLIRRGINKKNIVLLPPPSDEENKFSPPENKKYYKEKLNLPTNKDCLLFVGRLTTQKGMPFLKKVIEKIPSCDYIFLLIGKGPYKERFKSIFDDNEVRVEGHIPYSEIEEYYKASDIYISSSPYEGIPLTFIEALKTKIPVIARKAGDVEFITPNIIETPGEMVDMIVNNKYETRWLNKKYFQREYQKDKLNDLIEETISSS